MAMAFALPAHARDWLFEPSVGASATYSDNANQSATNPQDALILSVTPGFTLRSQGSRRVRASVSYGLTGVARFSDDNSTDLNHHLSATGTAELIEDFLFIDGNASISQELISLLGSPADAEINDSNRATVGTYSISPYIK
ncbi:MAG: TIGR03016 family PEP-CTERM system-associated outer membrane protein, partial [Thiobacillus sp.]|nr:TIGR03016 family PEP-CTERM system-associated outer membrane protein [Thiobacillus sp.]